MRQGTGDRLPGRRLWLRHRQEPSFHRRQQTYGFGIRLGIFGDQRDIRGGFRGRALPSYDGDRLWLPG